MIRLGRVYLEPGQDPMVLATMRDLGGVDLTAIQIAEAIGYRCSARPPFQTDVVGRLSALRNRGKVYRHAGAHRGGWCLVEDLR
jgi:hypothetical protein